MRLGRSSAPLLAFLSMVVLWLGPVRADEPVELKLDLREGQTFHTRMTMIQTIELPDRQATMDQRLGTTMRFDVIEVESDGTQTLTVTYTHVALKQQLPTGPVDFDSSRPPEAELPLTAQPFAAMVDQSFTVSLSPKGQVRNIKGLDKLVERMLSGLKIAEGPAKAAMEKGIREQFGQDAMRQNLQNMMNVYPDKPVKVGDAWSHTAATRLGFPVIAETKYRVTRITADAVELATDSKISPNPDAPAMDMGTLKIRYDLSGTQSGTMTMDRKSGWTTRSDIKQSFAGTLHVVFAGQQMDEPIKVNGTVTLEPAAAE